VIALGYDQIHQEKFISDGCKQINLDVEIARLLSPIPELSSSDIQKKYGEDIHDL
jgi:glycerol-3-phosphate cytidylyltransferase-like family protein